MVSDEDQSLLDCDSSVPVACYPSLTSIRAKMETCKSSRWIQRFRD